MLQRPLALSRRCSTIRCRRLHSAAKEEIIFSGIQPTGIPHLGNYLGALKNWVSLQNSLPLASTIYYSMVDLHAITIPFDRDVLRRQRDEMWYVLYAVGIDMQRCIVFEQSTVPEHAELNWILGTLTPMGLLNRMTQWKAKLEQIQSKGLISRPEKQDDIFGGARLGLFTYPVLQAADILLYNATHVPVGDDQTQHLETTRIIARQFNKTFPSSSIPTFNIPETIFGAYPRIASLTHPTKKMSKSEGEKNSKILLTTAPDEIRTIISRALTDSMPGIYASPERPGITNLLNILAAFEDTTVPELEGEVRDMAMREFKEKVAESIISGLSEIQSRYNQVKGDISWLENTRTEGTEKARHVVSKRMTEIKRAVGLL